MPQPLVWDRQYTLRPVIHLDESGQAPRARGYQMPMRRMHRTVLEYVDRGVWQVEYPHGQPLRAPAGRFFVVPTDCPHQLTQVGRASQSHWWMLSLLDPQGLDILQRVRSPWLLSRATSLRIIRLLKQLRTPAASGVADHLRNQSIELRVMEILMRSCPQPPPPRPEADVRIENVLQYIREHLHERLSRSRLADLAHLSPTRFHYVFAQAAGTAPTQYIIAQRLQRAREMLVGTSQSIKSIARACGFADPARFSRVFHDKVGMSPLAYRQQFPAAHIPPPSPRPRQLHP